MRTDQGVRCRSNLRQNGDPEGKEQNMYEIGKRLKMIRNCLDKKKKMVAKKKTTDFICS